MRAFHDITMREILPREILPIVEITEHLTKHRIHQEEKNR